MIISMVRMLWQSVVIFFLFFFLKIVKIEFRMTFQIFLFETFVSAREI